MELGEQFYKELIDTIYEGIYFVDLEGKITYWSKGAELLLGFAQEDVAGRRWDDVLDYVDAVGKAMTSEQCPIAVTLSDGRSRSEDIYCRDRQGHLMPVAVRTTPIRDEQGELVGAVELFVDKWTGLAVQDRVIRLEEFTTLDKLTGLPNRQSIELSVDDELSSMKESEQPCSILVVDIDFFKPINDKHGHLVGDELLKHVAKTLAVNLRTPDVIGRWGGDEFVVILPLAGAERLTTIADRLRVLIEESVCTAGDVTMNTTISIGGTEALTDDTRETLFERADQLLYRSKESGRNRVTIG